MQTTKQLHTKQLQSFNSHVWIRLPIALKANFNGVRNEPRFALTHHSVSVTILVAYRCLFNVLIWFNWIWFNWLARTPPITHRNLTSFASEAKLRCAILSEISMIVKQFHLTYDVQPTWTSTPQSNGNGAQFCCFAFVFSLCPPAFLSLTQRVVITQIVVSRRHRMV